MIEAFAGARARRRGANMCSTGPTGPRSGSAARSGGASLRAHEPVSATIRALLLACAARQSVETPGSNGLHVLYRDAPEGCMLLVVTNTRHLAAPQFRDDAAP